MKLAFANSLIPLIAAGLDLGLTQSCLALSFEYKKNDYLALNLIIKAAIIALAFTLLAISFLTSNITQEVVLAVAAASMSFWAATRAIEQYSQHFRRYALLNIALATTRLTFGLAAIAYNGWIALVFAVYVLAQLPIQVLTFSQSTHLRFSSISSRALGGIVRMAPITFLSTSLFSSLPLLTLWLLNSKGNVASAAAFGVVLMFLAPIDLLFATLKVYILPKTVDSDFSKIDLFGLGHKSMYLLMITLGAALAVSIIPAAYVIDLLYHVRFPEADLFFVTYFSCHAMCGLIGIYTLRSQRPGFIRLSLIANVFRGAATAALVFFSDLSPIN